MGYLNGYIASIIVKKQPLREFKYNERRTVKVPFGSEYILRLKNKSKDPALVEVAIDGTDVLNGSQLVLKAGETIDLERFVDDKSNGKKFKYISLEQGAATGEIDDPYREENGLIRVIFHKASETLSLPSFTLNRQNCDQTTWNTSNPITYTDGILRSGSDTIYGSSLGASRGLMSSDTVSNASMDCNFVATTGCCANDLPVDKGATIEGSDSSQSFSKVTNFYKSGPSTIVDIYMVGPNYVVPEVSEWGIYLESAKEPIAKFAHKNLAYSFAGTADFGKKAVTIKEIA